MNNIRKKYYVTGCRDINSVNELRFPRYTYDMWMKRIPHSDFQGYRIEQRSDSYISYLQLVYSMENLKEIENQDLPVRTVLIDDAYDEWLGDRKNNEMLHYKYCFSDSVPEDMEERVTKAGLNELIYRYALPVVGILSKKTFPTRLSQNTVDLIWNYYDKLINNKDFTVWVSPYLFTADRLSCEKDRIEHLANLWFESRKKEEIVEFEEGYVDSPDYGNTVETLFVPIYVKERGGKVLTVREIGDTLGEFDPNRRLDLEHIGRFLSRITNRKIKEEYLNITQINKTDVNEDLLGDVKNFF